MLVVELHDLRQDRKRRIVHDHASRLVLLGGVVSARIEWPHEPRALHVVPARHPVGYRVIYELRRVAVVRCLFRLELLQELVILFVVFLSVLSVLLLPVKPFSSLRLKVEQVAGVEPFQIQRLALLFNLRPVPAGQLRRSIVPDRVVAPLGVGQMVQPDAGNLVHAQLDGRQLPPVSLHDQVVLPDANGIIEPVQAYALFYLLDVRGLVLPGVALVRLQLPRVQVFDLQFHAPSSCSL